MSSLDRILPFLEPIKDLLVDPAITEVMVNAGGRHIFVERNGCIEAVPARTLEDRKLTVAIKNIARACGDEISERQPVLDARLEDGSRVAAMFPPCAVDGPTLKEMWDVLMSLVTDTEGPIPATYELEAAAEVHFAEARCLRNRQPVVIDEIAVL